MHQWFAVRSEWHERKPTAGETQVILERMRVPVGCQRALLPIGILAGACARRDNHVLARRSLGEGGTIARHDGELFQPSGRAERSEARPTAVGLPLNRFNYQLSAMNCFNKQGYSRESR